MIPLIQKELQEEYDFLKYSTPNSGRSPLDKVILLAFKKGEPLPSWCIKTVRQYGAKQTVLKSFENLKTLNALMAGSGEEALFPRAVRLYDDGEHVFSIETAVPGRRERLTPQTLARVVRAYTAFQAHAAQGPLRALDAFAETLPPELHAYYDRLPQSGLRLPRAIQLGDLTEDNVLLERGAVHVVDFDRVGEIDLPGFDLFGLLRRFDAARTKALCAEHLPGLLRAVGAEGAEAGERLLFLYYVAERTVRKGGGEAPQEIIRGFEALS